MPFSNVTLTSEDGDLSVVVYLPFGLNEDDEDLYYYSSRFDHGSMIGAITRKRRSYDFLANPGKGGSATEKVEEHVLYGSDMWRVPHNANWPESGVGLAAEFGAGDDGSFCYYRCGWTQKNDVTNGVLGYQEARNGESFLKIGVGELLKGTCPTCDSTDDYKFNSPYLFAKPPYWKLEGVNKDSVKLFHAATLGKHGYNLLKETSLVGNVLTVTSTLTNTGQDRFSTVWYSHNFFTCDGDAVGPGYSVDLNLHGGTEPLYEEPGTWSWATPLAEYGEVTGYADSVNVKMVRALEPGVRIKSEFVDDGQTVGSFRLEACQTSIHVSIPELEQEGTNEFDMYAYNLYVERGTFSPEPQILMHLDPGQSKTWTQRLEFNDLPEESTSSSLSAFPIGLGLTASIANLGRVSTNPFQQMFILLGFVVCAISLVLLVRSTQTHRRRRQYTDL